VLPRTVLIVVPSPNIWPNVHAQLSTLHDVRIVGEIRDACQAIPAARLLSADVLLTIADHPAFQAAHRCNHCGTYRPSPALSAREQRVLRGLAQGRRERDIAASEQLTLRTVERTVAELTAKLAVPSRVGIVAKAALLGMITAEDLYLT
jgi:DNA-binding CsgD family transcriptional regulator